MDEDESIPRDDLEDVYELTHKLQDVILDVLQENEMTIAMSSLISASVNSIINQCEDIEEIVFYKKMTDLAFDQAIRRIRINEL